MVPFGNNAGITLNVDSGEFRGRGLDIFQQIMGRFNVFVEQGNIAYLLNTRVTGLITDSSGTVIGVKTTEKDGKTAEYRAKATILASGGFADNQEMLDKMYTRYGSSSGGFSIGNMFDAAKAVGAQTYRMDVTRLDGGMLPLADRNGAMVEMEMKISTPGFVWLNKDGQRVENESGSNTFKRWDAWRYARDNTIYVLLDQALLDKNEVFYIGNYATFVSDTGNKRFHELLNAGKYIWKGNTIEEAAEKAGLNPQAVAGTLTAYNQYCRSGRDPDFGRSAAGLIELKPPFYIAETIASIKGSLGGLIINPRTQVLKSGGVPIPGLYAAGEIVGNIASTGQSWFGGVCLILGAGYGQIAGQNALALARGQ
jgi:succinate dehydrogenase/fumarate reductase flavoprotein subunit